jgi:glycosyltransferase involved in cell wall biosynthesis
MTLISFVTTCKGRLSQLQRSLPHMLAQPESEVIVVDYDCPDHTTGWVTRNYPAVKVVCVTNRPRFNASAARNLGAAQAQSEWLCFIDADITPSASFVQILADMLRPGYYYHGAPFFADKYGTFLCRREDFDRVGGYDEVFDAWSQEDKDLYRRLEWSGLQVAHFDNALLGAEFHDDTLRTRYFGLADRWLGMRLNGFYMHAKADLIRLTGELPSLELRQALYAEVKKAFATSSHAAQLEIGLPLPANDDVAPGWTLTRKITLTLVPQPPAR